MAGAMCKLLAEPRACDYATRHIVHLCAANRFTSANILPYEFGRRIARLPHNIENARVLFWNTFTDVTSPGLVSRDSVRLGQLRGRIDQHEIAAFDWRILFLRRHVVRIG